MRGEFQPAASALRLTNFLGWRANVRDEVDQSVHFVVKLLNQMPCLVPVGVFRGGFQVQANLYQSVAGENTDDSFERMGFGRDGGVIVFRQRGVKGCEARGAACREFVEQCERKVQIAQAAFQKLIPIERWCRLFRDLGPRVDQALGRGDGIRIHEEVVSQLEGVWNHGQVGRRESPGNS